MPVPLFRKYGCMAPSSRVAAPWCVPPRRAGGDVGRCPCSLAALWCRLGCCSVPQGRVYGSHGLALWPTTSGAGPLWGRLLWEREGAGPICPLASGSFVVALVPCVADRWPLMLPVGWRSPRCVGVLGVVGALSAGLRPAGAYGLARCSWERVCPRFSDACSPARSYMPRCIGL